MWQPPNGSVSAPTIASNGDAILHPLPPPQAGQPVLPPAHRLRAAGPPRRHSRRAFHLVKLANDALTTVRRRVTWDLRDRRGRKSTRNGPTGAGCCGRGNACRTRVSRRCGTPSWPRTTPARSYRRGSPRRATHTSVHRARRRGDPHLTRHRLHRFLTWCIDSQIPELLTLASTIDTWWPEINAFIQTGITNARTEGYNRLVKQVKRVACGFRNPDNSARRIRFHCTRKLRAATQTSC